MDYDYLMSKRAHTHTQWTGELIPTLDSHILLVGHNSQELIRWALRAGHLNIVASAK